MSDDDVDLRAALERARLRGMTDDLAGPAIRRGRQVQRRRTAIGAGVGVIAAVGAIVAVTTLPGQRPDVILATPSPVASTTAPSPTPASPTTQPTSPRPTSAGPTAKQPGGVPGLWGTFTQPITLLHDGVGAQGDASAWATFNDPLLRCDPETKPVLAGLVASRAIASTMHLPRAHLLPGRPLRPLRAGRVRHRPDVALPARRQLRHHQRPVRHRHPVDDRPAVGLDEDPRFCYWADRLGLTLWGETAAAYTFDSVAVARLASEWVEIVRQYESHPSIIAWVPFNESWGVTHIAGDPAQQAFTRALADLTRALDPTRPVISNDGWEHTNSDLLTIHDYEWRRDVLEARYTADGIRGLIENGGPAGRVLFADRVREGLPVLLTEFGGVEFVTSRSADETWGYFSATDAADFEARVRAILEPVQDSAVLRGWCWTQLTDTLQEANGLCDENRVPKLPVETLREMITR